MTTPVTLIGGYLGAGKTTLINGLLRNAGGERLAVLVNEFGELPIDADLIEAEEGRLISIAGGCICCAFGDDLMGALTDLARTGSPPDHIIIETSGVAIPGSIAATLSLLQTLSLNAIITLADATDARRAANDTYVGDTVRRQLTDAHLIALTKTDLIDQTTLEPLQTFLSQTAPQATQIIATGPLNAALLGPRTTGSTPTSTHADPFETLTLPCNTPTDPHALAKHLADPKTGLVRAKGFVQDEAGNGWLVQTVGPRWEVTPATPPRLGVVCIGPKGQINHAALPT